MTRTCYVLLTTAYTEEELLQNPEQWIQNMLLADVSECAVDGDRVFKVTITTEEVKCDPQGTTGQ